MLSKHVDIDGLLTEARKSTDAKVMKSVRSRPDTHAYAYASRINLQPLPKYEMPERSIASDHAYQIVKDELELDGKPSQNCASFVTTFLEPNCKKLMLENITKNLADVDEYPQTAELQTRCISMLANLFNRPPDSKPIGAACIGSSEGILMGGLAMKFAWRERRRQQGKSTDKPNIVFGNQAHVAIEKFARYFDVEPRIVPVTKESNYCMSPEEMIKHCDENTIGCIAILGSTYTGQFEEVKEMNDRLIALEKDKGWDIPLHIDAASGGFIAPFLWPNLLWDFRLEKVVSINVSGHKFGYVVAGIGWIVWKDEKYLPKDLKFELHYLGGTEETFNLNFSRNAAHVVAQYYNLIRLGREGYTNIARNCFRNAQLLGMCLEKSGYFRVLSDFSKPTLPVVSFLPNDCQFLDPYVISSRLRGFGWIVPAYCLPPKCQHTAILRIVIRENFSEDVVDLLLRDIFRVVESLQKEYEDFEKKTKEIVEHALKEAKDTTSVPREEIVKSLKPPSSEPQAEQQKIQDKQRTQKTFSRVC